MPELRGVVIWTVRQDDERVQMRLARYDRLLTGEERDRATRFLQRADHDRFVIGRALARTMLAHFGNAAPTQWDIVVDEHGRPELGRRLPGTADLRFNLSHTDGLVACAVTVGRELGVDVEHIGRQLTHDNIPERFFSAREVADLRALPAADQRSVFFDYWTLKEAYIKARGLGLALPLGEFSFLRHTGAAPTIEFAASLQDDPASWQFAQFWPTREHRMAVAVRRTGSDLSIDVSETVPEAPA